jgi:RNA polymerase sigma-70 factor (ECF subfamily)
VDDRDGAKGLSPLQAAQEPRVEANPGRVFEGQALADRIELALQQLSPNERVVFELRHYDGMRLLAIGEAVGISEEAAKNSLFRATHKLRAALQDARA